MAPRFFPTVPPLSFLLVSSSAIIFLCRLAECHAAVVEVAAAGVVSGGGQSECIKDISESGGQDGEQFLCEGVASAALLQKSMNTNALTMAFAVGAEAEEQEQDSDDGEAQRSDNDDSPGDQFDTRSLEEIAKEIAVAREEEEKAAQALAAQAAEAAQQTAAGSEAHEKADDSAEAASKAGEVAAEAAFKAAEEDLDSAEEVQNAAAAAAAIRNSSLVLPGVPVWSPGSGIDMPLDAVSCLNDTDDDLVALELRGAAAAFIRKEQSMGFSVRRRVNANKLKDKYKKMKNKVKQAAETTVEVIEDAVEAVSEGVQGILDCLDIDYGYLMCKLFMTSTCNCEAGSYMKVKAEKKEVEMYCLTYGVGATYSSSGEEEEEEEEDEEEEEEEEEEETQSQHRRRRRSSSGKLPGAASPPSSPPNTQRTKPGGLGERSEANVPTGADSGAGGSCDGFIDLTLDAEMSFVPEFTMTSSVKTKETELEVFGTATFYIGAYVYAEGTCSYEASQVLPKQPLSSTYCTPYFCITVLLSGEIALSLEGKINGSAYVYFEKTVNISAAATFKPGDDEPKITVHKPSTSDDKGIELAVAGSAKAQIKLGPHIALIPTPGFPVNIHPWSIFEVAFHAEASYAKSWTHDVSKHEGEDSNSISACAEAGGQEPPVKFPIIAGARWEFTDKYQCTGNFWPHRTYVPIWDGTADKSASFNRVKSRQDCALLCLSTPGCMGFKYPNMDVKEDNVKPRECVPSRTAHSITRGEDCQGEVDSRWDFYSLLDENCPSSTFCGESDPTCQSKKQEAVACTESLTRVLSPILAGAEWEYTHEWNCHEDKLQCFETRFDWSIEADREIWAWDDFTGGKPVGDRRWCAKECLETDGCKAFSLKLYDGGDNLFGKCCLMGQNSRQSTQRGQSCGGPSSTHGYFTLIKRDCNEDGFRFPTSLIQSSGDDSSESDQSTQRMAAVSAQRAEVASRVRRSSAAASAGGVRALSSVAETQSLSQNGVIDAASQLERLAIKRDAALEGSLAKAYFAWRVQYEESRLAQKQNQSTALHQSQLALSKEQRVEAQQQLRHALRMRRESEAASRRNHHRFNSSFSSGLTSPSSSDSSVAEKGVEMCWAAAINVRFGFDFAIFFPEWLIEQISDILGFLSDGICAAVELIKSALDEELALIEVKIRECLPGVLPELVDQTLKVIKGIVKFADQFCEKLGDILPTIEDILNGVNFQQELFCRTIAQTDQADTCGQIVCR